MSVGGGGILIKYIFFFTSDFNGSRPFLLRFTPLSLSLTSRLHSDAFAVIENVHIISGYMVV